MDLQQQPGGRADPARPTAGLNAAHAQTRSPCNVEGFLDEPETESRAAERMRTSGWIVRDTASFGDEDRTELFDGLGRGERRGERRANGEKAERHAEESKGSVAQRQTLCPTGGKTLIKDPHTKKNSLDDLFIFCSSKILFHMNVSVFKEKKVCLLYYLCLLDEKYFLFFVLFLSLLFFHVQSVEISRCPCKVFVII